ncbi:hypothetical protein ACP70R_001393 [Stipagrostis hirtigluma subsp. patula]
MAGRVVFQRLRLACRTLRPTSLLRSHASPPTQVASYSTAPPCPRAGDAQRRSLPSMALDRLRTTALADPARGGARRAFSSLGSSAKGEVSRRAPMAAAAEVEGGGAEEWEDDDDWEEEWEAGRPARDAEWDAERAASDSEWEAERVVDEAQWEAEKATWEDEWNLRES